MDYYEIGQRIRKYRKACSLSQESLAERVGISVTHMSHIETGNTKLSLPVLVDIAAVLNVRTDDLLRDSPVITPGSVSEELAALLAGCTAKESRFLLELLSTAMQSMRKHL